MINYEELKNIKREIALYPNSSLLLVTKNRPKELVDILIQEGFKLFGENRVQEAEMKFREIIDSDINLHLIGPLQTNKVKMALNLFDTIQSIDRSKLVREIAKNLKILPQPKTREFFIQINIGYEEQKSGVKPEDVKPLYDLSLSHDLNISGFMCIPPDNKDPKTYFEKMDNIRNSINPHIKLSMGMSNDYQVALECNSNLVRIGSRIFK